MLAHLGLEPILDLGMRLGEGTGGALAMGVIEGAVRIFREMLTFEEAGVPGKA
jgi:nicotinate-nucleotide--dimethylbenzimidazole phosphoribosyltransferase